MVYGVLDVFRFSDIKIERGHTSTLTVLYGKNEYDPS